MAQSVVVVRGGGDLATAVICRLHNCGFRVVVLETIAPTAIRRTVSLSEAVYKGAACVEGVSGMLVSSANGLARAWDKGQVPVLVDPAASSLPEIRPWALIDAIVAKKNCGTRRDMAPVTIALGPGFIAGVDVDAVIETVRGHDLGRIIYQGEAAPNTGIPGEIAGKGAERVCYAPRPGKLDVIREIGSRVETGEIICRVDGVDLIISPFRGMVRGMLRHGSLVDKGMKIADIDPRSLERGNCFTISDKARNISGSVLEALLVFRHGLEDIF